MAITKRYERQHDSISIPEGHYIEPYTPIAGAIRSPSLNVVLQRVKVHLSEETTLTGKDARGNLVTSIPLAKGQCPYLWSEIHSVGSGTVWIIHDGVPAQTVEDMNYRIAGINQ